MNNLFIDFETSGFPSSKIPADHPKQAWIVEAAMILMDEQKMIAKYYMQIQADGRSIHPGAQGVHGISVEQTEANGMPESIFCFILSELLQKTDLIIGHNVLFEYSFMKLLFEKNVSERGLEAIKKLPSFCTMKETTDLCKLPGRYGKYKWPKLTELYACLFDKELTGAHNALVDTEATQSCYNVLNKINSGYKGDI